MGVVWEYFTLLSYKYMQVWPANSTAYPKKVLSVFEVRSDLDLLA